MTSARNLTSLIVFTEEKTLLPEPSRLGSVSIGSGRTRISNHPALGKKMSAAGWTFFYVAGTVRMKVVAFDRARMIPSAVNRLLAAVVCTRA